MLSLSPPPPLYLVVESPTHLPHSHSSKRNTLSPPHQPSSPSLSLSLSSSRWSKRWRSRLNTRRRRRSLSLLLLSSNINSSWWWDRHWWWPWSLRNLSLSGSESWSTNRSGRSSSWWRQSNRLNVYRRRLIEFASSWRWRWSSHHDRIGFGR